MLRGGGTLVVLLVRISWGVLASIAPCVALAGVPVRLAVGLLGRSVECETLSEVPSPAVAVALLLVRCLATEMRVWWDCGNGIGRV